MLERAMHRLKRSKGNHELDHPKQNPRHRPRQRARLSPDLRDPRLLLEPVPKEEQAAAESKHGQQHAAPWMGRRARLDARATAASNAEHERGHARCQRRVLGERALEGAVASGACLDAYRAVRLIGRTPIFASGCSVRFGDTDRERVYAAFGRAFPSERRLWLAACMHAWVGMNFV